MAKRRKKKRARIEKLAKKVKPEQEKQPEPGEETQGPIQPEPGL